MTNLRKKWKRSVMIRKALSPAKKAWRAREISWFELYLHRVVITLSDWA